MEKKYKTEEDPETGLLRIIALNDFSNVKKGRLGGLIEKEENLSQEGNCWIYEDARVWGNAKVYEDARVFGYARVYGNAQIHGKASVFGEACVSDNARVFGRADVYEWAGVFGNATIFGNAIVRGEAKIYKHAKISEEGYVFGEAQVYDNAEVSGKIRVCSNARVFGNVKLWSSIPSPIETPIENNKDYIISVAEKERDFRAVSLRFLEEFPFIFKEGYLKNIQTIRQIYGKEI